MFGSVGRIGLQSSLGARAGKPRWTPLALSTSLLGWWSADRSDLITLSGSQVSHWKDVVAGYDCAQAVSGSRPLYSATGFNGAPGVTFDGIDDCLQLASVPFPAVANASELWALVDQTALPADATTRVIVAYGGTVSAAERLLARAVVSAQNLPRSFTNGVTADITADFSGRHVVRAQFTGTNAVASMDGTDGTPNAVVPNTGTTKTSLGANTLSTTGQFFQGVMRDVIVTGALTTAQAALLKTYLYNRRMP